MKIKILGAHNTESWKTRHTSLLVDDILALDAGGLTSSLSFPAQKRIRVVLLTHYHYDHLRDIPALAMNHYLRNSTFQVISLQSTYDALSRHFLDGDVYPNFLQRPEGKPTIRYSVIQPLESLEVAGYQIMSIPLNHSIPATGYQISAPDGKILVYTGDTGSGLSGFWPHVTPGMLFIEVTASNRWEEFAKKAKHLCPNLLKHELLAFQRLKGYLPPVMAVHLNPLNEKEIQKELAGVSKELGVSIRLAFEGQLVKF